MKKVLMFCMLSCLSAGTLSAQDAAKKKDPTLSKSQNAPSVTAAELKKRDDRKKQSALKKERSMDQLSPDQKQVALRNKKN